MNDSTKWLLFIQGDEDALSEIFLSSYDDLYNYGMKLSSNNTIVQDAIQDLFLKLWKNRKSLSYINTIKPYLLKSLRHHILDSLELNKPRQSIHESMDPVQIVYSPEDFLIQEQGDEELHRKIISALNKLTSRQREAVYLRFFEELEFETIAHIMEMNVQSVRNSIHRAIITMRELGIREQEDLTPTP